MSDHPPVYCKFKIPLIYNRATLKSNTCTNAISRIMMSSGFKVVISAGARLATAQKVAYAGVKGATSAI